MVKGKRWTVQEESELKSLIESNMPLETISEKLAKTPGAIILKSQRLGLKLDKTGYILKLQFLCHANCQASKKP